MFLHICGYIIWIPPLKKGGISPSVLSLIRLARQEQRSNASLELQRKQQLELIHSQALG
jgi:hypothetical protein